jgi:hypothetical protein
MKPIIISPYMDNIDPRVVASQKAVISHLCPDVMYYQHRTASAHGDTLDRLLPWLMASGYDTALILDIDAIPLSRQAVMTTLALAHRGSLVGNIQRSNHIKNDQHTFIAPSFMGIDIWKWMLWGSPSFRPTTRGDVAEEVTYRWEECNGEVLYYMPMGFEAAPIESPSWKLADGMPDYGCGTTFGADGVPVSYHAFQISHGRNVDNFLAKCEAVLGA